MIPAVGEGGDVPKRGGVCDGPRGPSLGREGSRCDLSRRTQRAVVTKKIFPALQAMTRRGHLDGPVVGVARSDWTLEQFRARARESIERHGPFDEATFARLRERLRYAQASLAAMDGAAAFGAAHNRPSATRRRPPSPRPWCPRGRPRHAGSVRIGSDSVHPLVEARRQRGEPTIQRPVLLGDEIDARQIRRASDTGHHADLPEWTRRCRALGSAAFLCAWRQSKPAGRHCRAAARRSPPSARTSGT